MIQYLNPHRHQKVLDLEDYKKITRDVGEDVDPRRAPASLITAHMRVLRRKFKTESKQNRGKGGTIFETVVYDAIVRFGVPESEISSYHHEESNAEADLYFPGARLALMLKVSMRERWKQWDRDAAIMQNLIPGLRAYGMFWREHENDSDEASLNLATSRTAQCLFLSKVEVITTQSDEAIARMFKTILDGCKRD